MIDPKELMQGNYIKYLHSENEFSEVVGFDSENVMLNEITHDYVGFDECQPIPITEEWLLKFGFSDKDYKNGYIGKDFKSGGLILDFVITKPFLKGEWQNTYTFDLHGHRFVRFDFIHQLQNLFFSLTGKKLTLKSE